MPARPIHEPRRDDCPWCGSKRLRTRLRTPDLRLGRPGTFTVDACEDCAHTFQNPRLTPEGLALYGSTAAEEPADTRRLRAVARTVLRHVAEPESWLDVGTGEGRFPEAAREVFPYTSFDGLDPTARVVRARDADRVEEAHVGSLTDPRVLAGLRGRYDVVSMLHHLEHTRDPRHELWAARTALRPGGLLLLELPDPASASADLLGKWWPSYDQPRHLHLIPLPNLRAELAAQGWHVLGTDRRAAHVPRDLTAATALYLTRKGFLAPPAPLLTLARAADHTLSPAARRTRFANAYRVIARKEKGR
ncbi:class I SAM-dependent methyltransferase [Streptomyces longwoodensis]|uniref:class I SAM-dependent methyltransferase n=1 Tax=Streptomyces longwoodensis TaxID=68231 RepID=UPI0033A7AC77